MKNAFLRAVFCCALFMFWGKAAEVAAPKESGATASELSKEEHREAQDRAAVRDRLAKIFLSEKPPLSGLNDLLYPATEFDLRLRQVPEIKSSRDIEPLWIPSYRSDFNYR